MVPIPRELKEVEHIYNITLKNNRSLETVRTFLKKLANYYDSVITRQLEKLYNEGKIEDIPKTPIERANLFKQIYSNDFVNKVIDEYILVRLSMFSEATVYGEHRKTLRVIFHTAKGDIEYDLKKLKELLERAQKFYEFIQKNG